MNQGKIMNIYLLRQLCLTILSGKSLNETKAQHNVARSTVIRYKKKLRDAKIMSYSSLLALNDDEFIRAMYGAKAVVEKKPSKTTVHIGKDNPNHTKKDLYDADFKAYAKRYAEEHNVKKSDIYVDYVKDATAHGKSYLKDTAFRVRLNAQIALIKGPNVTMHREHAYGDELQLDWCGDLFDIRGEDNKAIPYGVMVLTWAASCYVYAVFVPNQTTKSTVEGLISAFTYFNCLPKQLVIDNAKQMVTKHAKGREAVLNPSFDLFMRKCGVPVNANNPHLPNEKSQVEQAVNLVQTRVLTRMRGKFLLLEEANLMLTKLVEEYINEASFRGNKDTPRVSLFNTYEKPAARKLERALPTYVEHIPNLVVNKDYHVKIHDNYYSVPFIYAGKTVDVSIEGSMIKIYLKNSMIESHVLRTTNGAYITKPNNMPKNHQAVFQKELKYPDPESIFKVAETLSGDLLSFCKSLLNNGSFQESKKGCIYMINRYLRHPNDRLLYDSALQSIMHDSELKYLNTYVFDKALKELKQYRDSHDGEFPVQTSLDFGKSENTSVTYSSATAFVRSSEELLKSHQRKAEAKAKATENVVEDLEKLLD